MKQEINKKLKTLKRYKLIRTLVIIAAVLFLVFRFVIGVSFIDGNSMNPTFEDGDFVIYSRLDRNVHYGDVIALKLPTGEKYVKRIVAEAGDTVDIRDGLFYLNGQPLDDKHTLEEQGRVTYPLMIEEGNVFYLGDNRPESIDSRFYGPANLRQVQGVLKLRFHNFRITKVK